MGPLDLRLRSNVNFGLSIRLRLTEHICFGMDVVPAYFAKSQREYAAR